jgi:hypothetical protein
MTDVASTTRISKALGAAARNVKHVHVPAVGEVVIPPPERVAYYAGMGVLAAVGLIEWPLAVLITAGHVMADQQVFSRLRGLGQAAESV